MSMAFNLIPIKYDLHFPHLHLELGTGHQRYQSR